MSHITALASVRGAFIIFHPLKFKGTSIIFHPKTFSFIIIVAISTTNMAGNVTHRAKCDILFSIYLTINRSHIFVFEVKTFHGSVIISYLLDDTSYSALIGDTLFYLNIKLFKTIFNFLPFFQDVQRRFYGDWRGGIHPFHGFLQTVRAHIILINGIIGVHFL